MSESMRPTHAADRLIAAIESKKAPVCVGLDPVIERLPKSLQPELNDPAGCVLAMIDFCSEVIHAVSTHVPCIKMQAACFERYPTHGWHNLALLLSGLRITRQELVVILDAKRGDIGISAEHYAAGAFESDIDSGPGIADWLTINSYLGDDGITPFLRDDHGAFALVRTSNPGGDRIQNLELKDGRTVSHAVAEMIAEIGSKHVGRRGYSSLGAVVGATKPQDARQLREIMPQQIFLVPGYGAQGGGIEDVLPCFKSDKEGVGGAIVTASRSVIYAFKPDDPKWMNSVADAAAKFADEVGRAVGMRS